MPGAETLGILDEIEALVSDKLQAVSYKWLSRNFLVSSDTAKRLLQEFVDSHADGLQVVYSLSGCLKKNPLNYTFMLVPGPKLEEAKEDFNGCCSVQVYSVQACIPKDPATIRNAEFMQAAELFGQPAAVENCFRDNRFCGISNSFARRNAEGASFTGAGLEPNGLRASGSSSNSKHGSVTAPSPQLKMLHQMNQKDGQQFPNVAEVVKGEAEKSTDHQVTKPTAYKGKATSLPSYKKGSQNNKNNAGAGGSLANLWSTASTKSKDSKPIGGSAVTTGPDCTAANAEAQICAREAAQVSSDDETEVNFRRTSNREAGRKRRVVFDLSDEEDEYEDAVDLASPGLPKAQSLVASKDQLKDNKLKLDMDGPKEDALKLKKENSTNELHQEDISPPDTGRKPAVSTVEKVQNSEINSNVKTADDAPTSSKRKKMLKTRIDERGREVTEVVWEGEEMESSKADSTTMKKENKETTIDTGNRPPVAKKPPSVVPSGPSTAAGKAKSMKAGSKDSKQGNILAFFKRV